MRVQFNGDHSPSDKLLILELLRRNSQAGVSEMFRLTANELQMPIEDVYGAFIRMSFETQAKKEQAPRPAQTAAQSSLDAIVRRAVVSGRRETARALLELEKLQQGS